MGEIGRVLRSPDGQGMLDRAAKYEQSEFDIAIDHGLVLRGSYDEDPENEGEVRVIEVSEYEDPITKDTRYAVWALDTDPLRASIRDYPRREQAEDSYEREVRERTAREGPFYRTDVADVAELASREG